MLIRSQEQWALVHYALLEKACNLYTNNDKKLTGDVLTWICRFRQWLFMLITIHNILITLVKTHSIPWIRFSLIKVYHKWYIQKNKGLSLNLQLQAQLWITCHFCLEPPSQSRSSWLCRCLCLSRFSCYCQGFVVCFAEVRGCVLWDFKSAPKFLIALMMSLLASFELVDGLQGQVCRSNSQSFLEIWQRQKPLPCVKRGIVFFRFHARV